MLQQQKIHVWNGRRASLVAPTRSDADLSEADLRGASLIEADLRAADLRKAYLVRGNLFGADLSWGQLGQANLSSWGHRQLGGTWGHLRRRVGVSSRVG